MPSEFWSASRPQLPPDHLQSGLIEAQLSLFDLIDEPTSKHLSAGHQYLQIQRAIPFNSHQRFLLPPFDR